MVAEIFAGGLEIGAGLIDLQRRQRIIAAARRLEDIAAVNLLALQIAGLAGDAEFVLGAVSPRSTPIVVPPMATPS